MSHISRSAGTIWHKWCENASKSPDSVAIIHCRAGLRPRCWTWGELIRTAESYSAALTNNGIKKAMFVPSSPGIMPCSIPCTWHAYALALYRLFSRTLIPVSVQRSSVKGYRECAGIQGLTGF
jgi:acyl-CoA synthetase (AMP-forming)/AMP-acid ligase II